MSGDVGMGGGGVGWVERPVASVIRDVNRPEEERDCAGASLTRVAEEAVLELSRFGIACLIVISRAF